MLERLIDEYVKPCHTLAQVGELLKMMAMKPFACKSAP